MPTGTFTFLHPWALAFLAALPVLALLAGRAGRAAALRFPSTEIAREAGKRARSAPGRLALALRLTTLALLIIACAGPRITRTNVTSKSDGIDIMLVMDLSPSMYALDMSPKGEDRTRADMAKSVMRDFVAKRPDDRIGLVAFSGKPYLISPLTLNHDWLDHAVSRLDAGVLPEQGTAIGDAVAMAADRMSKLKGKGDRVIILLTDGDDNSSQNIAPVPAAELAKALGERLYTIGIGKDEPTPMPVIDPRTGRPARNRNGEILSQSMMPPANYSLLGRMAELTGGRFYRAKDDAELVRIYEDIGRLEKSEVRITRRAEHTELFALFAAAALATLLASVALANTRHLRLP